MSRDIESADEPFWTNPYLRSEAQKAILRLIKKDPYFALAWEKVFSPVPSPEKPCEECGGKREVPVQSSRGPLETDMISCPSCAPSRPATKKGGA